MNKNMETNKRSVQTQCEKNILGFVGLNIRIDIPSSLKLTLFACCSLSVKSSESIE